MCEVLAAAETANGSAGNQQAAGMEAAGMEAAGGEAAGGDVSRTQLCQFDILAASKGHLLADQGAGWDPEAPNAAIPPISGDTMVPVDFAHVKEITAFAMLREVLKGLVAATAADEAAAAASIAATQDAQANGASVEEVGLAVGAARIRAAAEAPRAARLPDPWVHTAVKLAAGRETDVTATDFDTMVQAHRSLGSWTRGMDEDLVALLEEIAIKLGFEDGALELQPHELDPSPRQRAAYPLLPEDGDSIRLRSAFLILVNRALSRCIRLIDPRAPLGEVSVGAMLRSVSHVVIPAAVQQVMTRSLCATTTQDATALTIELDPELAQQSMEGGTSSPAASQCMFVQLAMALEAVPV